MMRIDTDIERMSVEIEGEEYEVAEKTVAVADALIAAAEKNADKPNYKIWMADLEVLLGKDTVRKLFPGGKNENLDRMQRIHAGVLEAFDYNSRAMQDAQVERQREMLEPVNDFMRRTAQVLKMDEKKGIRRG